MKLPAATRLSWVEARMPILATIRERHRDPLSGRRIAMCGHITKESAVQVLTLVALGAEVAWCPSSSSTTDDAIAEEMRARGIAVYGRGDMSERDTARAITDALTHWPGAPPDLVLDEGGELIETLVRDHPRLARSVSGGVEKTPTGRQRLLTLQEQGRLPFPVLEVDRCFGKQEVDNPYGTAQSILQTITAAGGVLLAGKTFVVAGFGSVGAGLARLARGLGAQVVVTEVRPTRALFAALDGYTVLPIEEALPGADVICTVTGAPDVISGTRFDLLKPGAILANGGHHPWEINLADLGKRAVDRREVGQGNERVELRDGRHVHLLGGGHVVNLAAGEGNVAEVMDVIFATQVLGLLYLGERSPQFAGGIHPVPLAADDFVAEELAAAMGIRLGSSRPGELGYSQPKEAVSDHSH